MKTNQKLTLLIKAGLIVLAGLSGASVRASELSTVKREIFPMPAEQEALYRKEFDKIWDPSMITRDRVRNLTPSTLNLRAFSAGGNLAGVTFSNRNLIIFPVETNSFKRNNSFTGEREHAIAHEFVHFAVDSLPQVSDEPIPETLDSNQLTLEYNFDQKVREFYAELKGLELLQQRNPRAFNKKYHYLYTECVQGVSRNEGYPNAQEFLLCWSLYQQKKAEDSSADLRLFIDYYLRNRNCYKAAIQSTQFLKKFQEQRERTLQGKLENFLLPENFSLKFFMGGAIAIELAGFALLCGDQLYPKVELSNATVYAITLGLGSLLPAIVTSCIGANEISDWSVSLRGNLYNSRLVWNRDKFQQALDKDAVLVERSKKLDGMWVE